MKPAVPINQSRGMETEYGPAGHADAVLGHGAQHQRAGRQARTVNHDAITRLAQALKHINELP
jgi:hypothetical protein